MAYEYPMTTGVVRLLRIQRNWAAQFSGHQRGRWPSPDVAVVAAAQHESGLSERDRVPALPCCVSQETRTRDCLKFGGANQSR